MTPPAKKERNEIVAEQLCLFFILVYSKSGVKALQVEAAKAKARSVGPFLRGAKVFFRLDDYLCDEDLVFLDSLRSAGMNTLPFSVSEKDFHTIPLTEWASGGGHFLKRVGSFGSLRPFRKDKALPGKNVPTVAGTLVSTVVYLHLSIHRVSCRLKFQYSGLPTPIGAFPSAMPLRSEKGIFFTSKNILTNVKKSCNRNF